MNDKANNNNDHNNDHNASVRVQQGSAYLSLLLYISIAFPIPNLPLPTLFSLLYK